MTYTPNDLGADNSCPVRTVPATASSLSTRESNEKRGHGTHAMVACFPPPSPVAADATSSTTSGMPESEALHAHMAAWFGIPQPTETEYQEVFGWYHVDDNTRYWVFNPVYQSFRVITGDHKPQTLAGAWEDDDLEQIGQVMNHLSFLPRPPLPTDPNVMLQSEPFSFEGWSFAWFFVPELRRWELGVLERRWRVERAPKIKEESLSDKPEAKELPGRRVSRATKSIAAGAQLFQQYRKAMLLIGTWTAPDPRTGFRLIAGASAAAASEFSEQTDVVRLVAKATGCEEKHVQEVMGLLDYYGWLDHDAFRPADFAEDEPF